MPWTRRCWSTTAMGSDAWPHFAGADAVKIAGVSGAGELGPIFIRTRRKQLAAKSIHRFGGGEPLHESHRRNHRLNVFGVLQHARIDYRQIRRIGTLQRQAAAIGLLQQVTGEADHVADAGNGGDVAQDDVKIDILARRIALEIKLQGRAAARIRLVAAGFRLERHRHHRMILVIFTDAVESHARQECRDAPAQRAGRCPRA